MVVCVCACVRVGVGVGGQAIALTAFVDSQQPPNMEARKQRAVFYNNRAAARSNQNKHEEAIEDTTAAIKLDFRCVRVCVRVCAGVAAPD